MRRTKFRPTFDNMDHRITPSDLSGPVGMAATPVPAATSSSDLVMPGEEYTGIGCVNPWYLSGAPQVVVLAPGDEVSSLPTWVVAN